MKDVTKSTEGIIHYKLRPNSYRADIIILFNIEGGFRFIVISEFGNWDTYWGAPGESINKFLVSLNNNYLQGRLETSKRATKPFKRFLEIIWPVFIAQLKEEEEDEKEREILSASLPAS